MILLIISIAILILMSVVYVHSAVAVIEVFREK